MLSYVTVGSNDIEKSTRFYTELLATQGVTRLFDHPRGGVIFASDAKPMLAVLTPFDGNPATVGNGSMVAFELPSREAVDAFHAKAISLGATDEGAPGERAPGSYLAYFRDLDGNKFCACRFG